jgi:hypothetical protein
VGDIAGIVAGLAARGDDRSAAAVEQANALQVSDGRAKQGAKA